MFAIIVAVLAAASLQACGSSTAGLTHVKMCNDADGEGMCSFNNSTFSTSDKEIYLSADLENVSDGMKVNATWSSLREPPDGSPQVLSSFTSDISDNGSFPYHTYLSAPETGWPTGDYEVTLTLTIDNSEPVTKKFSIE